MKQSQFSDTEEIIAKAAKLLGHPARVSILNILKESGSCLASGEIAAQLPLGRTTVLQHLANLKDAGWVQGTLRNGQINYCVNATTVQKETEALQNFMQSISEIQVPTCETIETEQNELILFLCTGNSCRSQMAEAFLRVHGAGLPITAVSAGTKPAEEIHPLAVKVMAEKSISLKSQTVTNSSEFIGKDLISLVIFVCDQAERDCPYLFPYARRKIHLPFDDPASAQGTEEEVLNEFRRIRDEIEEKILLLVSELSINKKK